jgi:hypothetical protein
MTIYMKSVLEIVNSAPQLQHDLMPIIRLETEEIYWSLLNHRALCGGSQVAAAWCKTLWQDKVDPDMADLFWSFGCLDRKIQNAILRAVEIKHGL